MIFLLLSKPNKIKLLTESFLTLKKSILLKFDGMLSLTGLCESGLFVQDYTPKSAEH